MLRNLFYWIPLQVPVYFSETPNDTKVYSSSPWLQHHNTNYTNSYVNGPPTNSEVSLAPTPHHADTTPNTGAGYLSGNDCLSDSTADYRTTAGVSRRYDNRSSYCGKRYTLPNETASARYVSYTERILEILLFYLMLVIISNCTKKL